MMRNDLEERYVPILAHETIHGINEEVMSWDDTGTAYMDEGIATHTEDLIESKETNRTRELFGEERTYTETEDGEVLRYTIPPRGDQEALWNYYQDDRDFMKYWHPRQENNRNFGYAYSQLVVRNYLTQENRSMHDLYDILKDVDRRVDTPEEKWEELDNEIDMEPCNYDSRPEFESCIDEINEYNYTLYMQGPERSTETVEIEKVEVENQEEGENVFVDEEWIFRLNNILEEIEENVRQLLDFLRDQFVT